MHRFVLGCLANAQRVLSLPLAAEHHENDANHQKERKGAPGQRERKSVRDVGAAWVTLGQVVSLVLHRVAHHLDADEDTRRWNSSVRHALRAGQRHKVLERDMNELQRYMNELQRDMNELQRDMNELIVHKFKLELQ